MMDEKLLDSIKKEIKEGNSTDDIISDLIFAGWDYRDIEGAFGELHKRKEIKDEDFESFRPKKEQVISKKETKRIEESFDLEPEPKTEFGQIVEKIEYNKKNIIWSLGIVVFVLVGMFLWYQFSYKSPENIVRRSFVNLAKSQNIKFNTLIEAKPNQVVSNSDPFLSNVFLAENLKINYFGVLAKENSFLKSSFGFSVGRSGLQNNAFWEANIINTGSDNLFLKLSFLETKISDWQNKYESLVGRWIKVEDKSDFSKVYFLGPEIFFQKSFVLKSESNDIESIRDFLGREDFFSSIEELPSKKIDGEKFYHYKFSINSVYEKDFLALLDPIFSRTGLLDIYQAVGSEWDVLISRGYFPYKTTLNSLSGGKAFFNASRFEIILEEREGDFILPPTEFLEFDKVLEYKK